MKQEKPNFQEGAAQADFNRFSARIRDNLRDTFLGQFYLNQLKKYRIVKLLAPWIWRKIQFLYLMPWIYIKALKRPLVSLSDHAASSDKTLLSKGEIVNTPIPETFPESSKNILVSPHAEYEFPETYIAEVHNALVTGATNLVVTEDAVICHDLYDFTHDSTSEELNGRTYIWPNRKQIAWLMRTVPDREIEQGACFTDACAQNYAHWMTEVLPRINLFCLDSLEVGVPIIVNDGLHRNILESLRLVTGNLREIVSIRSDSAIMVEHLYITSATGYVPFDRRTNRLKNHSHGMFSRNALLSLRKRVTESLGTGPHMNGQRLFIRRNSAIRNLRNSLEIETELVAIGFTVIEPENLTFAEQVRAFSNAGIIVGATGAAFANLIFCKPSAKIVILISNYKHMPYWYWQNMACAVNSRVSYVVGTSVEAFPHLHSNFVVDPSAVLKAVNHAPYYSL